MGVVSGIAVSTLVVWCWAQLLPELGNTYSPDSYALSMLGSALWRDGNYASLGVRDSYGLVQWPSPSRSFPPLFPLLLGPVQYLTGSGIHAGTVLNLGLLPAVLILFCYLGQKRLGVPPPLVLLAFALFFSGFENFQEEIVAGR
ncbi:MAG: hypothetical protein KDD44_12600, partial [Bdellovibrionales bacterium]|nr:hypothetical protein [Bdellovibrionales bacterium]